MRNLGIERLKSVGYTVNSHNWSFLSWFFHHEEHEEHKEIIKALLLIFVRLRVLRGLIFPDNSDRLKKRSLWPCKGYLQFLNPEL